MAQDEERWAGAAGAAGDALASVAAARRRRELTPRVRKRLELVKGVALGQPFSEGGRGRGRTARTVERWLRVFAVGGAAGIAAVAAVADAPRHGRPVKADVAYLAALEHAVETPPPSRGVPFDVWTSPWLSASLAETTGVRIAPGWVRALLARQRCRCGRPKHTLRHLQDPAAATACEEVLRAVGEKGAGGRGRVRAALPG